MKISLIGSMFVIPPLTYDFFDKIFFNPYFENLKILMIWVQSGINNEMLQNIKISIDKLTKNTKICQTNLQLYVGIPKINNNNNHQIVKEIKQIFGALTLSLHLKVLAQDDDSSRLDFFHHNLSNKHKQFQSFKFLC